MSTLGQRLKEERKRFNLDQTEFSRIGGVTKNSQSNYENNIRNPDAGYLAAIAALGIDIGYVVTGTRTVPIDSVSSIEEKTLTREEAMIVEAHRAATPEVRKVLEGAVLAVQTQDRKESA